MFAYRKITYMLARYIIIAMNIFEVCNVTQKCESEAR